MHTVLLVEDDVELAQLTRDVLVADGYTVRVCHRGDDGLAALLSDHPDVVILDLMLPGMTGQEVCRRARAAGYSGCVLMLTARGDPQDEVEGLKLGSDDYLKKPFRPRILLARIKAVLRRSTPRTSDLTVGRLALSIPAGTATLDGEPLALTPADFAVLTVLAQQAGTIVPRDRLWRAVFDAPWDGQGRAVDLRVSRLRRKLPDGDRWIKSIHGTGYLLAPVADE